jgi:hypothetical protein
MPSLITGVQSHISTVRTLLKATQGHSSYAASSGFDAMRAAAPPAT